MGRDSIGRLIADLAEQESRPGLFNPYRDERLAGNLRLYLEYLASRPLELALIGEAAGHRGCALTGMAFTSPETLRDSANDFFSSRRDALFRQGDIFEPSGRYVWGVADAHGLVPLLWNALPFHPCQPGQPRTNRTPTKSELELGQPFLERVLTILRPRTVVAVGKKAEQSLAKALPDLANALPELAFASVRHPSMGGSTLFRQQMDQLLRHGALQREG